MSTLKKGYFVERLLWRKANLKKGFFVEILLWKEATLKKCYFFECFFYCKKVNLQAYGEAIIKLIVRLLYRLMKRLLWKSWSGFFCGKTKLQRGYFSNMLLYTILTLTLREMHNAICIVGWFTFQSFALLGASKSGIGKAPCFVDCRQILLSIIWTSLKVMRYITEC